MIRLTKLPVLTGTIFAITAAMNTAQFIRPGTLQDLRRESVGMHGDWWRTFTSLFVQDGGVYGTLSNLAFLVLLGVVAEQVLSRPRWLISYFGVGLVGEMFGYLWQPVGAGNSVAICGLAGAIAIAIARRDERLPIFAPSVLAMWLGVLLATWFFPLIVVGIVGVRLVQSLDRDRLARLMPIAATVVGGVLCSVQNIHGGALLAGLALGAALTLSRPVLLATA